MDENLYNQIQEIEQSHWWYVARRKIIFDWVLRSLAKYDQPEILDIGCGTGFNLEYLKSYQYANVTGLDFSVNALKYCRSRSLNRLVLADGTIPPFKSNAFDMITALDFIEHVEDDVQCIQNLTRVLKPNGSLVIFTPAFQFLWGLQDEVSHHFRRYTRQELNDKLTRSGLVIKKLTYINTFLFPVVWAGRMYFKLTGKKDAAQVSENEMHPSWSNSALERIFSAERPLLHYLNFPFGVSLLCVAEKVGER